jgi:hypothetical protein
MNDEEVSAVIAVASTRREYGTTDLQLAFCTLPNVRRECNLAFGVLPDACCTCTLAFGRLLVASCGCKLAFQTLRNAR